MDITQWDIQEVKALKKKQLVQNNFIMLLLFGLLFYFAESGKNFLIIGTFFVLVWIAIAIPLYTLKTGRPIGTKTSKRVQKFDRDHSGEKRWKRNKITEVVVCSVIGVGIVVFLFAFDFHSDSIDFDSPSYYFPFFGAWIGHNLGEIFRMNKLENQR